MLTIQPPLPLDYDFPPTQIFFEILWTLPPWPGGMFFPRSDAPHQPMRRNIRDHNEPIPAGRNDIIGTLRTERIPNKELQQIPEPHKIRAW